MDAGPATPRGVNRVGATSGAHQARFNAMTKSRARSAVIRSAHGTVHMFLAVAAVSWRPVTISSIDWAEVAAFAFPRVTRGSRRRRSARPYVGDRIPTALYSRGGQGKDEFRCRCGRATGSAATR
jgi:hypothetical protein